MTNDRLASESVKSAEKVKKVTEEVLNKVCEKLGLPKNHQEKIVDSAKRVALEAKLEILRARCEVLESLLIAHGILTKDELNNAFNKEISFKDLHKKI